MTHVLLWDVGLFLILITASLSSKTYNIALEPECVPLDGTWSMLIRSSLVFMVGICFCMFGSVFVDKFHHGSLTSLVLSVWLREEWNTLITKSQRSRIHALTCIKRNNLGFRWTVWDRGLFLAHPTYWYKCSASENASNSSRSRFWVFKISDKTRVLNQSQPALLCSVSHMTILFEFTRVVHVRYQSIQAFVTCFCLFRYRTSKFVHRPQNVWSTHACQIQAF